MSVFSVFITVAPQILPSYDCIQTADQLNCSCETVGNPPPALQWYLDGLPVNHSGRFAISSEPLNVSGRRSIITVSQPQQMDLSTLLSHSTNSLGSTTQRFFVFNLEPHGLSLCSIQVLLINWKLYFLLYFYYTHLFTQLMTLHINTVVFPPLSLKILNLRRTVVNNAW